MAVKAKTIKTITVQLAPHIYKKMDRLKQEWGLNLKNSVGKLIVDAHRLEFAGVGDDAPEPDGRRYTDAIKKLRDGDIPDGFSLDELKQMASIVDSAERGRKARASTEAAARGKVDVEQLLDAVEHTRELYVARLDESLWRELERHAGADYAVVKEMIVTLRTDVTDQLNRYVQPFVDALPEPAPPKKGKRR